MLEVLQEKATKIAEDYADLVSMNIQEANESKNFSNEKMNLINEGIRMLHHATAALERINRIQHGVECDLND